MRNNFSHDSPNFAEKMNEQFLFTKEKGSLFNAKVWMKLLVKKSTPCYGNKNKNRNLTI